jgi:dihydrofolate reductase
MRKLIVNTFLTLDGVMQAPGGPEEDPTGGFTQGGWSVGYWDDMMGQIMGTYMSKPFDLLLGRKTYEIFAAHWPYTKEEPIADVLNKAKKHVVSKTLDTLTWNNSTPIKGDVVEEIRKLKAQDGPEIQVHGSSNLIQTLLKNDLIDEYRLWVFPVTVGSGKRLFGEGTMPFGYKLVDSKTSTTGVLITTYTRDGEIKKGSFALDTPTEAELARRKKMRDENKK